MACTKTSRKKETISVNVFWEADHATLSLSKGDMFKDFEERGAAFARAISKPMRKTMDALHTK
jgi:hypothetical protein